MNPRVFDRFPLLATSRLLLRAPEAGDAADLFALRSDEENGRFQMVEPFADVTAASAQIARWRRRFELRAEIRWIVARKDDGAFVGTLGFVHFVPWLRRGHVAVEIARSCWGRGLGTEALAAAAAFGHDEAGLVRVEAVSMPGNEASARMMRKAGFEEEGLLRAYALRDGRPEDMRMFSHVRRP